VTSLLQRLKRKISVLLSSKKGIAKQNFVLRCMRMQTTGRSKRLASEQSVETRAIASLECSGKAHPSEPEPSLN
jgi:hypothetical protein